MNVKIKKLILYTTFIISIICFFYLIDSWYAKNIALQNNILLKEAKTLYQDQINIRKWNSMYGGVFVKPHQDEEPNPYLKDNTLKVNEKLTLMKINPAFMTRQLSELSNNDGYQFKITGLHPINPENNPNKFELRALKHFEKKKKSLEYYEFDQNNKFYYMGALITTTSCLTCHKNQNYTLGEVSGGISIRLDATQHNMVLKSIQTKVLYAKIFIFVFTSILLLLLNNQLNSNIKLQKEVQKRTSEIESTKDLMQKILDADMSFLFLTDKKNLIFTNKTVLDFAGYSTLEEFNLHFGDISSKFELVDDEDFLKPSDDSKHWIDALYEQQKHKNLKVLIIHNGMKIYFRPHAKKIFSQNKTLYLISFDVITNEYEEIQELEEKASLDHLTGLFNRRKLDEILTQEIQLSNTVNSPLSIIFLDIDHFKKVNDTLGHDVGDIVLIQLADILTSHIRRGDFVARWGGEEFLIALQSTTTKEAGHLAEKVRQAVETFTFEKADKVSISLGVTQLLNGENKNSFIRRVDEALYKAKSGGRNMVVVN